MLLPVAEARARLLALAPAIPTETAPLAKAAHRWAAADLAALRTQPYAALSAMDGYAIRFADMPGPWTVTGEAAAGHPFAGAVGDHEAVRIFTGAALPAGADTVLVQEEAARDGTRLTLNGEGPPALARNTRPRGLDFHEGDVLVRAGERLTPTRLALLATGGHAAIPVRRRLTVAIAATGDELAPAGAPLAPGRLPESNGLMLAALLADLPVDIVDLGILPDDRAVLAAAFAGVTADLLVTSGGASVGDHDLVRPALEDAGASIDFWRVALRPGKPMMAGRLGETVVMGLPGNPVSAFVTAVLFVRPLLAHMAGAADPLPRRWRLPVGEPLPANGAREDYLRGRIVDGALFAPSLQDSSMLRTLAGSDVLIVRPPHAPEANIGDSAEVLPLA